MNYNFAFAVKDYFMAVESRISTKEFVEKLKEIDKNYPPENLHLLQNLLDSHDTERLSSMIYNPDRQYDRDADERNSAYKPGQPTPEVFKRLELIAAFQMTYRGAPMIYYGDEAGMWGADDPHDRKPMVWGNFEYDFEDVDGNSGFSSGHGVFKVSFDKRLYDYYTELIKIRNRSEALQKGDVKWIHIDDNKMNFGFERKYGDELVIVFFNLSKESEIIEYNVPSNRITEMMRDEEISIADGKLQFMLWGESFSIYRIHLNNK